MLIAFDIGNTNTVLGVYRDGKMVTSWRMETDARKSADEYGMLVSMFFSHSGLSMNEVDDVIIATVVPSVMYTIRHMTKKYFKKDAIVVESGIKTGLIVKYDNPKAVGSDRIVNAVAAHEKYPGNLIIIDLGTATTFCAVTAKGEYLGGTIAPGLKISSTALFEMTAQLPKVELEAPGHAICRSTISGMQSGLIYGHMGMVEFIVGMMKKELAEQTGSDEPITVIATGGLSTMIQSGVKCIDVVDRELTLDGLAIIYEKNKHHHRKNHKMCGEER
ncbi:MAG: type III pantothenate kinase [Eubacteriales bacterium]|nr:type III pantothenate kinase [Eubacteriales bacterium]